MNRIEQTYLIPASVDQVWRALTDPQIIATWSQAPAIYTAEPEREYSLWDGSIAGRILTVQPGTRLSKTWKPTNWEREDSVVTFVLTPVKGGTRVDLVHENVEESDFDGTSEGWDLYYFGAIQRMFKETAPVQKPKAKQVVKKKVAPKKTIKKKAQREKSKTKKITKRVVKKKAVSKKPAKKK